MKTQLIAYGASLITLLLADGVWLGIVAKGFYTKQIGHLMDASPDFLPVIILYPLYALALTILVILPALSNGTSYLKVFLLGTLLGLAAYGAYDLTNQATLKDWPVLMTVVDLAWGTLLSGAVATVAVYIARYFS